VPNGPRYTGPRDEPPERNLDRGTTPSPIGDNRARSYPEPHRRRSLSPLRALQLAPRTPGRAGGGSPPRTSGIGWSAASSPGPTGCSSRCQPGECQPWTATCVWTARFASRRQADDRRVGWSGVRRKRFAKPGRPQRSQRRSFVVGQPHASRWASQARQAQGRQRCGDDDAGGPGWMHIRMLSAFRADVRPTPQR
jgi:hypothetical protein